MNCNFNGVFNVTSLRLYEWKLNINIKSGAFGGYERFITLYSILSKLATSLGHPMYWLTHLGYSLTISIQWRSQNHSEPCDTSLHIKTPIKTFFPGMYDTYRDITLKHATISGKTNRCLKWFPNKWLKMNDHEPLHQLGRVPHLFPPNNGIKPESLRCLHVQ